MYAVLSTSLQSLIVKRKDDAIQVWPTATFGDQEYACFITSKNKELLYKQTRVVRKGELVIIIIGMIITLLILWLQYSISIDVQAFVDGC